MNNIKQFFIRLITYPFCAFLIILGYQMIFETPNYEMEFLRSKAKISGIGIIIVCAIYLLVDIAIIIKSMIKK